MNPSVSRKSASTRQEKKHPDPERKSLRAARYGLEVEIEVARVKYVRWRVGAQGLVQLTTGVLARKALVQSAVPIVQSRVVARDQVGKDMPQGAKPVPGQQGPGGGMGGAAGPLLDMGALCVQTGCRADVALKGGPILSEVVPQAGE